MTTVPFINPLITLAEGLIRGIGIGGVIIGILAAIGVFLLILAGLGYLIVYAVDVAEEAKDKASDVTAEAIRAVRARRQE